MLMNILAEGQRVAAFQGCKEQLIIVPVIPKQTQTKQRNIFTAFVDNKKAFDSISHSSLVYVLKLYNKHPTLI